MPLHTGFSLNSFFGSLFTRTKLTVLFGFLGFVVLAGHFIWFVERRMGRDSKFNRNYFPGIFEGMYWVIVTANTVGYGDRVPQSTPGWMFAIILIISALPFFAFFIAKLSSDITMNRLKSSITGPDDLVERRVGVVDNTFHPQYYGLAVPQGSHLREDLNRVLLKFIENGTMDTIREKWFGRGP